MEAEASLLDCLQRLADSTAAGDYEGGLGPDDVAACRACVAVLSDQPEGLWQALGEAGVSMVAVAKALGERMKDPATPGALAAASFFACLLRLPGCPVGPALGQ